MNSSTILLLVVGSVVVLAWVMYWYVLDTPPRRRRTAKRLVALGFQYHQEVANSSESTSAFQQLAKAAESHDSFGSTYAISVLGSLAREYPTGRDTEAMVRIISDLLVSPDPYVRHAAAEALLLLGTVARGATDALEHARTKFPNESAGMLAARALDRMSGVRSSA
jgi:HEAT repeat protein